MIGIEFASGKKAALPSSWGEMTPEQVRRVFRIHSRCVRERRSPLEFNVRVLAMLLDAKLWRLGRLSGDSAVAENVYMLCDRCLGFLFAGGNCAALSFDSVKNPLPRVSVRGRRLSGPADLLQDLSFGEFRHALNSFQAFFSSGSENDLDEAVAFLYRRRSASENPAGRKVRSLSQSGFSADVRLAAALRPWEKNLIMLWFSACVQYIQTGRLVIDGETVDMSLLFNGSDGGGPAFGWSDLLVEIAKDRSLGTVDQVDERPLFTVLGIMWHNYKENKRYEQNVKNRKA